MMAKDWLLTVVDDDLKSRLKGANGDQIQRDQTVMDTARRTWALVEAETPLYSRRRVYYTMKQDKGENFTTFMFRKKTEARSALIDSMSNDERMIHELMRSMLPRPLFIKFCEAGELTLKKMKIIATDHETGVRLTVENNCPQSVAAKAAKDDENSEDSTESCNRFKEGESELHMQAVWL